jgi:Guanylate-binding protein, N-terminal domain
VKKKRTIYHLTPFPRVTIILFDTEGLYSIDKRKGKQYDAKLFALSVLLASYLIFNTTSRIDEKSIDDLGCVIKKKEKYVSSHISINCFRLVTELTKLIHTKSNTTVERGQEFHQIFPSFLWLLRDSFLDLAKYASPREYLLASNFLFILLFHFLIYFKQH